MVTAAELLAVWEKGIDGAMFERALLLLEAVLGESRENLAELTIGQRDLRLLKLREMLFGRALPCLTVCPACHEPLELNLDSDDLRVAKETHYEQALHTLTIDGLTLEYRLPNSFDLSATSSALDSNNAREILLERCLLTACDGDNEVAYNALQPKVLDALATAMAEVDPQSHLELTLTCPSCEQNWSTVFDITSYLWSEIQNWAMRTLREVYLLASAFGWREADILALSPLRRQLYLQSVGA